MAEHTLRLHWKDLFETLGMAGRTLVCMWICLSFACHSGISSEKILFDFESDAELDQFHWKCHTLSSLTKEHATRGNSALRLELFPSDFPGLHPMLEENDWSGFKQLAFDVFNTEMKEIQINLRIDDKVHFPDYGDRYNGQISLKPGMNRVVLPLESLATSGHPRRKLDLKKIYRLLVFMDHPREKVVLHLDYFRLN